MKRPPHIAATLAALERYNRCTLATARARRAEADALAAAGRSLAAAAVAGIPEDLAGWYVHWTQCNPDTEQATAAAIAARKP